METHVLSQRVLGRVERGMAPVVWRVSGGMVLGGDVVEKAVEVGGDWFWVTGEVRGKVGEGVKVVVEVDADALERRRGRVVQERLEQLGRERCEAVMVVGANSGQIKAGGVFHRLAQLRERGVVELFFIDTPDYATAEWMVQHSPAHAVCLDYGIGDQTAKYRLLEEAKGFGTGILAKVGRRVWESGEVRLEEEVAFVMGEEAVTGVVVDWPGSELEMRRIVEAVRHPMPVEQREEWWRRFREVVAEPAKAERGHAPEFGA